MFKSDFPKLWSLLILQHRGRSREKFQRRRLKHVAETCIFLVLIVKDGRHTNVSVPLVIHFIFRLFPLNQHESQQSFSILYLRVHVRACTHVHTRVRTRTHTNVMASS